MIQNILIIVLFFGSMKSKILYDDDDDLSKNTNSITEDMEFEPLNPLTKDREKMVLEKNINCDDFSRYALNCTMEAAMLYNSSRKSPPLPSKMGDWCKAIRHLTNCAIDWNSECREVTESHFNEESIKGHMHVIDNVCDDEWFISQYDDVSLCLEATADLWEACYSTFKVVIEEQKNKSNEWSHYETHFYMCCARAQFRRCTLDSLFSVQRCTQDQASTLQKFSVIVSEGDVFQDCEMNMMYVSCPGGDPRPAKNDLTKLVTIEENSAPKLFGYHSMTPIVIILLI